MSEWKAKKEDTAVLCVLLYNHQQIYLHYSESYNGKLPEGSACAFFTDRINWKHGIIVCTFTASSVFHTWYKF